jgi:hypothetical protein
VARRVCHLGEVERDHVARRHHVSMLR